MQEYPTPYTQLLRRGPFPGRTDPFAEMSKYFHQIHDNLIGTLAKQMASELLDLGYVVSQEDSIQIADIERKPDIGIERQFDFTPQTSALNYTQAATAVMAEPGTLAVSEESTIRALHITDMTTQQLVTVVEIISPSNKAGILEIASYRTQRQDLFLARNINVVEIDLTRSYQRLFKHPLTESYPYHAAILLPDEFRVVGLEYGQVLKRCAIPLRQEVVAVDLQIAYDDAYDRANAAPQIYNKRQYTLETLPFPTLLTVEQREDIMRAVATWQAELKQLRGD